MKYSSHTIGIFYAVAAFLFWGMVPIYFKQVSDVNALEVLMHRVVWSVVVLLVLLGISKQFNQIKPILKNPSQIKYLVLSSFFVSLNWLIFIYAINSDKILEASLGYFINPLISIFFGYVFFSEKITRNQLIAIGIATFAVIIQLITIGSLPLISLGLAFSFALYGMVRKKVNIASLPGLFIETLLTTPFALAYLFYLVSIDASAFVSNGAYTAVMLSLAGLITVLPLLWFNAATLRLKLSTLGMLQYLGPSVAFLIAIFIYDEPLSSAKMFTFVLIWIALALFSYDILKKKRVG
ncbi:MAG: EamA family transporter RarD [Campylobacterota bacterium]|nr:EamA family transporter RarD [Campylobacterota bacterium]